ncbi:MAG TPA: C39 family peptidase [Anaerolineae bacterium]|nr:C39 family peptidase [Anaerolineae bacterium]HNU03176.1 C39 family peptidase [Anaerolineae bacterium]
MNPTVRRLAGKIVPLALISAALFMLAALALGSLRYGGPDGLILRVRVALAQQRSGPAETPPPLVPTPLPTPAGGQPLALLASAAPTASPEPALPTAAPAAAHRLPTLPTLPFAAVESLPDRPTATATPTSAPSPTPLPTATPAPPATPPPSAAGSGFLQLSGLAHYWQTWNNCGPATLAMNLSYYGLPLTQKQTAAVLKPNWDDKNVSPHELAAFARAQGLEALVRVNGSPERLRQFIDAGIPVLIETWLDHDGGMGHYRLVVGYDDAARQWIVYDSYISDGLDPKAPYPGIRMGYDELVRLWRVFDGTYVLVYDQAQAAAAQQILGDEADDGLMWQRSLARAQAEAAADPGDPFAWFNLGNSLAAQGRYAEAASAFDQARVIGLPWRMLWYQFEPLRAYYEAGRYAELLALADSAIATAGNIEEIFYWRGRALQATGDSDGARAAYQRAAELNSNYAEPRQALSELGG